MNSVKELLHSTVESLSDEEADQVLRFAQTLRRKNINSSTLKRLSNNPTFIFTLEKLGNFSAVEPIHGTGIPASKLLVEDRR